MSTNNPLLITPETKVGALLDAYPQLEALLLKFSPSFVALKNPILRKTVARVTTLHQAAKVGNVNPIDMVNALRKAVGLEPLQACFEHDDIHIPFSTPRQKIIPAEARLVQSIDVRPILNEGVHPKELILQEAGKLQKGEYLEFIAPFPPTPLIDMLKTKSYVIQTEMKGPEAFHTLVFKA